MTHFVYMVHHQKLAQDLLVCVYSIYENEVIDPPPGGEGKDGKLKRGLVETQYPDSLGQVTWSTSFCVRVCSDYYPLHLL